jgi:Tfp pilus assembly protein PilZ
VRFGDNQGKALTEFSVQLNSSGIFIETDFLMPPKTLLFLELELPMNGCTVKYKARVAWVNSFQRVPEHHLPVGMGVQFIGVSLEDLSLLRQYIILRNILCD